MCDLSELLTGMGMPRLMGQTYLQVEENVDSRLLS